MYYASSGIFAGMRIGAGARGGGLSYQDLANLVNSPGRTCLLKSMMIDAAVYSTAAVTVALQSSKFAVRAVTSTIPREVVSPISPHSGTFPRFPRFITTQVRPPLFYGHTDIPGSRILDGRACERPSRARTCHWLTRRRFVPLLPSLSNGGPRDDMPAAPPLSKWGVRSRVPRVRIPSDGVARLTAALTVVRRDVALRAPDGLDHRLASFVDSSVCLSVPRIPSPITASVCNNSFSPAIS